MFFKRVEMFFMANKPGAVELVCYFLGLSLKIVIG